MDGHLILEPRTKKDVFRAIHDLSESMSRLISNNATNPGYRDRSLNLLEQAVQTALWSLKFDENYFVDKSLWDVVE